MKRLFWVNIIVLLLLLSCTTLDSEKEAIIKSDTLKREDRAKYLESFYSESSSQELSYNYAYYLLENKDYDNAMNVIENAIAKYPDAIRFLYMKAFIERSESKLYSYEKTLLSILEKDKADTISREALITLYENLKYKDKSIDMALSTLDYSIDNKTALNALAHYIDFFKDKFGYTDTSAEKKEEHKKPSLIDFERSFNDSIESIKTLDILSSFGSD